MGDEHARAVDDFHDRLGLAHVFLQSFEAEAAIAVFHGLIRPRKVMLADIEIEAAAAFPDRRLEDVGAHEKIADDGNALRHGRHPHRPREAAAIKAASSCASRRRPESYGRSLVPACDRAPPVRRAGVYPLRRASFHVV